MEGPQNQSEQINPSERIQEQIALARTVESRESFPFPGIVLDNYQKIKATEAEFPGIGTPVDTIVERCKNEGIKVVFGAHPESGNVYILPCQSNDIENDSLRPRQLEIVDGMDEDLKKLILMDRV